MPRLKDGNPAIGGLKKSVFSSLASRIREHKGPVYPLHVGDTFRSPPLGSRMEDQLETDMPGLHRYENPRGRAGLIQAVVERAEQAAWGRVTPEQVLVTAGATGGLTAAVRALLVPGQKVMILAPFWPLIRGICVSHGLTVVEAPFYDRVTSPAQAWELLEAHADDGLAAIYVNSPNNPSGLQLPAEILEVVVAFAQRHDLWILSDEVYRDLAFDTPPTPIETLPGAAERTIRSHSFSKAYAMAGNRVGFVVGPEATISRMEQLTTYLVYSVNTAAQRSAEHALRHGQDWLRETRELYAALGREMSQRLGVAAPQGGTFLFIDVATALDARGMTGLLEDCLAEGILLSPGDAFGAAYSQHIRVCFTSAEPERVRTAIERLAAILGR